MGKQTFIADGRVLGQRDIENFRNVPGLPLCITHSYAYCCNECGEIWGRLRHEGAPITQFIYRPCAKHGDGRLAMQFPVAGQPLGVATDWPRAALLREFLIELSGAER